MNASVSASGSLSYAQGLLSFWGEARQRQVRVSGVQADLIHM